MGKSPDKWIIMNNTKARDRETSRHLEQRKDNTGYQGGNKQNGTGFLNNYSEN